MKLIIAGSRSITGTKIIDAAVNAAQCRSQISEIVSGHARGVDRAGELWASINKIPVKLFRADWDKLGKSAGLTRNVDMGEYADAAVVIWDQVSTGSKHMYQTMKRLGKPVFMYQITLEIDQNSMVWFNTKDGLRIKGY